MTDYVTILDPNDPDTDNPRIKLTREARRRLLPQLRYRGMALPKRLKDFKRVRAQLGLWHLLEQAEYAAETEAAHDDRQHKT